MPIYDNPDFQNLPGGVGSLFAAAAVRSFFSHSGWYDLLARHVLPRGATTRLYVATAGGRNVAALPCYSAGPGGDRGLKSLANFYSCEHGLVTEYDAAAAAVGEIARMITTDTPPWRLVQLTSFDPSDQAFAALAGALRRGGMSVRPYFESGTWYEDTASLSFAEYQARLPSTLRNTWRRKVASLSHAGRVVWRVYDSLADLDRGIADYETVYRASWKEQEPFPTFMPALMRFAAELGALRLCTLHLGERAIAAQFWIVWRGRACIYKLAHDKEFDALSPGTLVTMHLMQHVLERDQPYEVNFGRGDDPYKRDWLPRRRERWGIEAANLRTLGGWSLALRHTAARLARPFRHEAVKPRPLVVPQMERKCGDGE